MTKTEVLMKSLNTLVTDHGDPLAYAPGSDHHHLTISMLGSHGGQLERYIESFIHTQNCTSLFIYFSNFRFGRYIKKCFN